MAERPGHALTQEQPGDVAKNHTAVAEFDEQRAIETEQRLAELLVEVERADAEGRLLDFIKDKKKQLRPFFDDPA
jgi:hypothetical protein